MRPNEKPGMQTGVLAAGFLLISWACVTPSLMLKNEPHHRHWRTPLCFHAPCVYPGWDSASSVSVHARHQNLPQFSSPMDGVRSDMRDRIVFTSHQLLSDMKRKRVQLRCPGSLAMKAEPGRGGGRGADLAKEVEFGDVVRMHFVGRLEDGTEFDNSRDREPVEFVVGSGRVIGGVDDEIIGMKVGEVRSAIVPCEKAFGLKRADRIVNVSRLELADDVEVGEKLGIKGLHAVVSSVDDVNVEIDCNHPLCGEDLYLDVEIVDLAKASTLQVASFAGGCFWVVELAFQRVVGVVGTEVGFTHGHLEDPKYEQVCSGKTGHAEAVRVTFDPKQVSYLELLEVFFRNVDVTEWHKQGRNVGEQYRNGIYYHSQRQRLQAEQALQLVQKQLEVQPLYDLEASRDAGEPVLKNNCTVVTELLPNATFWPATARHQQYLEKMGLPAYKGCVEPIYCAIDAGDDTEVMASDFLYDD